MCVQISSQLLCMLVRYMDSNDINDEEIRQQVGQLLGQKRISITIWWDLLKHIEKKYPQPALGILIGRYCRLEDIGVLGHVLASCGLASEALLYTQRFEPLLHNFSYSWARSKGEVMHIGWETQGNQSSLTSDAILISSILTISRILAGKEEVVPLDVEIPNLPKVEVKDYEQALGCMVIPSNASLSFKVPVEALQLQINSANPQLRKILLQQAEVIIQTLPKVDQFLINFHEYVLQGILGDCLSLHWLSEKMALPQRTLHRKLSERGRSYHELVDALKKNMAINYLKDESLSLTEIAISLGYSEHSAFSRAFKKWMAITPLKYRKQLQGEKDQQASPQGC